MNKRSGLSLEPIGVSFIWLPHHWKIYNIVQCFSLTCYVIAVMLMGVKKAFPPVMLPIGGFTMWVPHHWQNYNVVRFFSELSIKIWFACYVLAVMLMDMNKGSHLVRAHWCFYYAAATQLGKFTTWCNVSLKIS